MWLVCAQGSPPKYKKYDCWKKNLTKYADIDHKTSVFQIQFRICIRLHFDVTLKYDF